MVLATKGLNMMNKPILPEILSMPRLKVAETIFGTVLGTAALVGIHHRYRKQQQPDARLQDYLYGLGVPLKVSLATPLPRLHYAYQQAKLAWQQHPQTCSNNNDRSVADFSSVHTTTMLARPVCWVSGVTSMSKTAVSIDDSHKGFGVVGIDADRQIVWQTTMPERVHDIVVQPTAGSSETDSKTVSRDVVVMGRRPSENFWVLDTATGQVQYAIKADAKRHFYGHACYSLDGKLLYVTENETVTLNGKIGIYDANDSYQKIAEFDSHGIGPHELIMHPDSETLIIANGGIKTEQASREELNLDSMRPSLVYLNRHDGTLLEQVIPEHNQMSIRHLAMHDDGTVMIGIQFQGEKHINVPLVLTHKRGDTEFKPLIMPNNQWQRFHQYIASVAVDSQYNLLCVTTPIGGCAAVYDLSTRQLIDTVSLPDCAGASLLNNYTKTSANDDHINNKLAGFIVSDGQGQLTTLAANAKNGSSNTNVDEEKVDQIIIDIQLHKISFDNHLQAL